jgi:hypothetical protein
VHCVLRARVERDAGLRLPRHVEVVVAPPGHPRTKPRACNIALERATGDLVTIYDADGGCVRVSVHGARLREWQVGVQIDLLNAIYVGVNSGILTTYQWVREIGAS